MADKPKTAFTKAYIEQRIEARIKSLESRVSKMQEEGLALTAKQAKGDVEYLRKLEVSLTSQAGEVREAILNAMGKPAVEVVDIVNRVESKTKINVGREGLSYQERGRLSLLIHDRELAEREIAMIEHALAYLKDSPVDEYSITALGKLGLLDAVKFSLELPEEGKRRR